MATPLEIKKAETELLQVQAAKATIELKIEEKLDEIQRLQEHIKISEARELELTKKVQELKNN